MGFNTGMSEDDVEEIRREYELELGGLENELATLRAENERLREALVFIRDCGMTANIDFKQCAKEALK